MSGELLLIVVVALIVFGPNKLPLLASHLGWLFRTLQQFKWQASCLWQQKISEIQLLENQYKAKVADECYEQAKNQNKEV